MGDSVPLMPKAARKTGPYDRFFAQAPVDEAIAALAASQHAVFRLAQLRELGLSSDAVRKRTERSRLHRIHHAVYAIVPRELLTRRGHWMAAVLACGPKAVLSHRNAAALYGIRDTQRPKIDVTVPGRSHRSRPGIEIHTSKVLLLRDTAVVDNIPCTSLARTKLDLAEVVHQRALERAFDESEMLELFDLRAIEDQLARNRTRRGAAAVKRVLDEHYVGSTPTWNEFEEAFYALCVRYGLPKPEVNQWVDLGDGGPMIRPDFIWRENRVLVETDGERFHGTHQARERDPRRDQRAIAAAWRPIRTTWRQVFRRPQELGPTLVALVATQ